MRLLEKRLVESDPLISHEFALEDYEEAFRMIEEGQAIKAVLRRDLKHHLTPRASAAP